jgi:hypothetical protein
VTARDVQQMLSTQFGGRRFHGLFA